MTRLIASLFVALALLVSPLAMPNAAAMAQMATCSSTGGESSCPDMDDRETPCTSAACVSVCVPFCFLPVANGRQLHLAAAKVTSGSPARLTGITPDAEVRPPRNISEM
ncbi:hypothetical protein [Sphingomonas koreensis]|uniref:hypothetical protein n=1 Tax=Sphingomonas koreensis TaxID=93064 RepID=UPI0012ECD4AF|nr:hypothetical protein [Sphingomonas koreensis]